MNLVIPVFRLASARFMSLSEVGYLVPLNQNFEEQAWVPKLAVSDGTNVIGRNNIPVPDKRLSRKHLTLTTSPNGSANLLVVLTLNTLPYHSLPLNSFFFLLPIRDFLPLC